MLDEAIRGYLISAKKAKLGEAVLNQKPDPEYERLWRALEARRPVPSPFNGLLPNIHSGRFPKGAAATWLKILVVAMLRLRFLTIVSHALWGKQLESLFGNRPIKVYSFGSQVLSAS